MYTAQFGLKVGRGGSLLQVQGGSEGKSREKEHSAVIGGGASRCIRSSSRRRRRSMEVE